MDVNFNISNELVSITIEINCLLPQLTGFINQFDQVALESGDSLNNTPKPKKPPIISAANVERKPHRIIKEVELDELHDDDDSKTLLRATSKKDQDKEHRQR